jgi:hypothetical protein
MTAFANTINNITPGSAGELVRLYLLAAQYGVDYTTGRRGRPDRARRRDRPARRKRREPVADVRSPPPAFIAVVAIIAVAIAPSLVYRAGSVRRR